MLKFDAVRPPVRRVLALDSGTRRFKLLLAESDFGRLRILKQEMIDLQAEGLVSPEEIKSHLRDCLEKWGHPPLALTLPEHISTSQVVDLPPAPESEVDKLIAEESIKLSGVSESRIVYDFVPIDKPRRNRQQFWVTLCQEGEIRERIVRLGIEQEDLCEVTTTANALIAAYEAAAPAAQRAVLVHLGAQTTVVVIVLAGQGAFATSFQMGGDFFTRFLARQRNCAEEQAEMLKREKNFLSGPDASPEFAATVDGWVAELKRQLSEWFQRNPEEASATPSFELICSGGGFNQPGLLEYLRTHSALPLQPWPQGDQPEGSLPIRAFEAAFGTALQALGHVAHPISLLPDDFRKTWQNKLSLQRVDLASMVLLALCLLVLGLGTWRKFALINVKTRLLEEVQAGQTASDANDAFTSDLVSEYENLRPVLAAQQNTIDTLKAFALLQQSRSNKNFWYVLLADQQSYFSQPLALLSTNHPAAKTNLLGAAIDTPRLGPFLVRPAAATLTNSAPARPGFIAELCVPGDAEASRQALSELVNGLKQQRLFSKVDLLSDDLRRNLADPKVTVPERDFVLALDFAETDFQQAARWKRSGLPGAARTQSKRGNRQNWTSPEAADAVGRNAQ
jgi:Tfp pilus assembly PilM family ATPase